MELQTIPLWFRVWGKEEKAFITYPDDEGIERAVFDVFDIHLVLAKWSYKRKNK